MRDERAEGERWLIPNGLAGGLPFKAFGERQAREAIEGAQRFVGLAEEGSRVP